MKYGSALSKNSMCEAGTPSGEAELDAINTITLRVVFSMGPHKAHQFSPEEKHEQTQDHNTLDTDSYDLSRRVDR